MSMTQRVVNNLRELAARIESEARQAARPGAMVRLENIAYEIREAADDLGDD